MVGEMKWGRLLLHLSAKHKIGKHEKHQQVLCFSVHLDYGGERHSDIFCALSEPTSPKSPPSSCSLLDL